MALLQDPTQLVPHTGRGTKAFFKPQTETKLPKFSGRDLDVYAEFFLRFLRSTGQEDLNERAKADLVINGCDNKDVKEVVSGALKKSGSWVRFLITLEKLYHLRHKPGAYSRDRAYPSVGRIPDNRGHSRIRPKVYYAYEPISYVLLRQLQSPPTPPTPYSSENHGLSTGYSREDV